MRNDTVRDMLLKFGVPSFLATLGITYMFIQPGASDPDNGAVIEIVKGLQRGLKKLGYSVTVNGVLDPQTATAMNRLLPSWANRTWVEIYQVVLSAIANPERHAQQSLALGGWKSFGEDRPGSLSGWNKPGFGPGGYGYGPLPGPMVGLPAGPLGLDGFTLKSGVAKPSDGTTLGQYQGLQRAISLAASSRGQAKIKDDGDIGPATLAAAKALGIPALSGLTTSVSTLAANAVVAATIIANSVGTAPNFTSDPRVAARTPSGSGGGTIFPGADAAGAGAGSPLDMLKSIPGGQYLPFVALGIGAAYFVVKSRKKGKR